MRRPGQHATSAIDTRLTRLSRFVLRRMSPQKSWNNGLLKLSNLLDLKIRRKAGTVRWMREEYPWS